MKYARIILAGLLAFTAVALIPAGHHPGHPDTGLVTPPATEAAGVPAYDHIVLIVMENRSYENVIGNPQAPYVNALAHQYALAANYWSLTHPSLPNYIALLSGSMHGMRTDCTDCLLTATNLVDQLEHAHKSWKAYFENLPQPCFFGSKYPYTRKVDPFVSFADIVRNRTRCDRIVPLTELTRDISHAATAPDFIWISPNLCHDTHFCSVADGDAWLSRQIPQLLLSDLFVHGRSLLIITWDEANRSGKNHVPAIFAGDGVRHAFVSDTLYTHYSLLHTVEASWGIPPITANVAKSRVMSEFFSGN